MKLKKNTIINRSFQSKAPNWITPIYYTVQAALNNILQNKSFTNQLIHLKLKHKNKKDKLVNKARGTLWKEIQAIIGNPLQGKINNSAWYNRILMTNIISLIKSHQQQVIIYNLLKANDFAITPVLRKQLSANNLYPTNVALSNLVKSRQMPDLPNHSILKLNYAFADKQLFIMDDHLKCSIQTMSAEQAKELNVSGWKDFQIYLPSYIRTRNLIKICKPVFIYSKKVDQIICQVPYQLQAVSHSNFKNILGIDLGKVKLYSGTVLYANNHYSQEFVPSKQLMHLTTKLAKLNDHVNSTYIKIKRCQPYAKQIEINTNRLAQFKDVYKSNLTVLNSTNDTSVVKIESPIFSVPITFMDKFNPESNVTQHNLAKEFDIVVEANNGSDSDLDLCKPIVNGKQKYKRILIRAKKGVKF